MANNKPEILGYCVKKDRKPWESKELCSETVLYLWGNLVC